MPGVYREGPQEGEMEILAGISLLAAGVGIGAVGMAAVFAKRYSYILDGLYDKGKEDGRKEERLKWLMIESENNNSNQ